MTEDQTDAIRRLVADAEQHQNDVDRFIPLHTVDIEIVNIAGRRVLGRYAFEQAMKQALASPLQHVTTKTEIEDIRFLRPDVALVACTKRVFDGRDPSVQDQPGSELPAAGSLTYVVVEEPDGWRIASAQTTPIRTS